MLDNVLLTLLLDIVFVSYYLFGSSRVWIFIR